MLKRFSALETARVGMVLVAAATGCAQVFGIDDWTESASGAGGEGGRVQGSASASTGSQTGSLSATVGSGGGPGSSASVGNGGAQSSSVSASVGNGGAAQSSSSGGPGSGSSASVSSSTGQGGSTSGLEDCTNGVDDDNDGNIDCSDSDCSAFMCVPPVPTGWQGFVKIYTGSPQQVPPCGAGWTNQQSWLTGALNAPPATCQCSCQGPTGGSCFVNLGDDHLNLYNDGLCTTPITQVTPISLDTCYLLSTSSITRKAVNFQGNTPASGGTCTPAGGVINKPPAAFDQVGLTCEDPVTGKGCANSADVCAPRPNAPFKDPLCIYKSTPTPGSQLCPTGYNKIATFYEDIMDGRGCAACTCGLPMSQSCPMTAQIYTNSNCVNPILTIPGDGSCGATGLMSPTATYYKVSVAAAGGSGCPPSAPMPIGEATGTQPAVVCCL